MVPLVLLAVLAAALGGGASAQEDVPICVVANLPASVGEVDLDLVRRLFLLRQRFWPDGSAAHPVNLPASSEIRERFSQATFGESVKELVPYWNERYFHGTRPPPTVASEAAVLLFVERTPGGVGYVREPLTRDLPDGVRELLCVPAEDQSDPSSVPPSVNTG